MSAQLNTISLIHDAYDSRKTDPLELARDYLARAKANRVNAWLEICEERALGQAEAASRVLKKEGRVPRARSPLFGIPIGIKDNFTIEGVRTSCASRILENYVPPFTSTAVCRLENAGAITLGKLNMDEFAMGGSNENSAFGPVEHPTHPGRVAGGSSGGSAAAVRAGECVATIGTDTGGSIRLPASFCGTVGFKPTYGRISRFGMVAFASSLDQAGPIASSLEDAAWLAAAMSGHDPLDSTSSPRPAISASDSLKKADWTGLRVGVPEEFLSAGVSPDVERSVRESLKWMEDRGARLVPVSLPHMRHAIAVYYLIAVSEASSNLSRFDGVRFGVRPPQASAARTLDGFYEEVRSLFGDEVKRRILLGSFVLSSGHYDAYYLRACRVRRLIHQDLSRAFEEVDLIAGPVAPSTAYRKGEKSDPLQMYLNDIFAVPANLAGLPALSVPCGVDSEGLPIGLQLIGQQFSDERLLSFGHSFEKGIR